jgi:hypothetical protein
MIESTSAWACFTADRLCFAEREIWSRDSLREWPSRPATLHRGDPARKSLRGTGLGEQNGEEPLPLPQEEFSRFLSTHVSLLDLEALWAEVAGRLDEKGAGPGASLRESNE